MRQRLGIAQALVHDPPVVILDEPTIGIDPQQVIEVRQQVRALGSERTVLLSTHILAEAEQLCDRVLIIHGGRLVAQGTAAELAKRRRGAAQIRLHIANGTPEAVTSALAHTSRVTHVEHEQADLYRVTLEDGTPATRAALSNAIAQHGFALIEMRSVENNLEAIFLDIIQQESKRANPARARA
jgi:ABC-2 type transport system ATP-binding protein